MINVHVYFVVVSNALEDV